MTTIITFAGFGGQGIIKTTVLLGAAAVKDGKYALQNQAYGPQSRGGISKGDVIISTEQVYELEPDETDVFIALSQQSFDKYKNTLKKGGLLIIDSDLVKMPEKIEGVTIRKIPATGLALKNFDNRILTGMLMLGYLSGTVNVVNQKCLIETIKENSSQEAFKTSMEAFNLGWKLAKKK